jgi:hypothetical protein
VKRRILGWSAAAVLVTAGCGESKSPGPAAGGNAGSGGSALAAGAAGTGTSKGGDGGGGRGGGGGGGGQAGGAEPAGAGGQPSAGTAGASGEAGGSATGLMVSPSELVFGAVQQTQPQPQAVTLKNMGTAAITLESVELDAAATGTAAFELLAAPAGGTELAGGAEQDLQVQFNPSGVQLFESFVVIKSSSAEAESRVALFGLGTRGLEGENEPFLQIVLTTLGFDVDVGGAGLLSTTTPLVGSEVAAQRFEASGAEPIELVPVARYSPEEPIPYGYYTASAEVEVGVISSDQFQELNPGTEPGSERSFAAPDGPFGIFTVSETHSTYTEDAKNSGNQVQHAVRTYPLKDRAGSAIPDAYLVCFEEAANGDYQDYVFTLRNVKPAL